MPVLFNSFMESPGYSFACLCSSLLCLCTYLIMRLPICPDGWPLALHFVWLAEPGFVISFALPGLSQIKSGQQPGDLQECAIDQPVSGTSVYGASCLREPKRPASLWFPFSTRGPTPMGRRSIHAPPETKAHAKERRRWTGDTKQTATQRSRQASKRPSKPTKQVRLRASEQTSK